MEKITLYGGTGSKKVYDQCQQILSDLLYGKSIGIMCLDSKKYKDRFFELTGHKISLKKLAGENNIYTIELLQ